MFRATLILFLVFILGEFRTAAASGDIYNAVPLRAVFNEDVRVVWFGDSFAVGATWRVSGASLLSWPFTSALTAYSTGDTRGTAVLFSEVVDSGVENVNAANAYRLYQTGPDSGLDRRFGVPVWKARERYHDGGPSDSVPLVEYQSRTILDGGSLGQVSRPEVPMRVRPMFLTGTDGVPVIPRLYDAGSASLMVDPVIPGITEAQIGAADSTLEITTGADGLMRFTLSLPAASPEGYVQAYGFTAWEVDDAGERVPGLSWSYLADSSWSYADFGRDMPAQSGGPVKTFSEEQLEHWFRATNGDSAVPVFVFYYFAAEPLDAPEATAHIHAMVEQTEAAAVGAGIGPVHHCFVTPHMHVLNNDQINPDQFELITQSAVDVAMTRDDMSVISIYHATDGILFNGSQEARDWIAARGHDNFIYGNRSYDFLQPGVDGDLLDTRELHPNTSNNAAVFFAYYAGRAIIDACRADFAAPYGLLDLADISTFVQLFSESDFAADLVLPQGVLDLNDVNAFVDSFIAGCGG